MPPVHFVFDLNRMGRRRFQINYTLLFIGILLVVCVYVHSHREGFATNELIDIPFHIEPTANADGIAGVPLVLYHSWHSNKVPAKMAENIYSILKDNPEFSYYLYSDEKSLEYIRENFDESVVNAFETLKPGAYKSDLWRYCVLYKAGGIYIDIKYRPLESLRSMLKRTPTIYVRDRDFFGALKCIYNGFMAAPPGNMIFKYCIDDIVNNCKMKLYNLNSIDVTGPCVLGRMLAKYEPNTVNTIKYSFNVDETSGSIIDIILYDNKVVMRSYKEYRDEQKQFQKTKPYTVMWKERDIYN